MTKVLKLGRNQEEAEIYNWFLDHYPSEVAGTWSDLYESDADIEDQNPEHLKIIAKYLNDDGNGFSRSGRHILKFMKEAKK